MAKQEAKLRAALRAKYPGLVERFHVIYDLAANSLEFPFRFDLLDNELSMACRSDLVTYLHYHHCELYAYVLCPDGAIRWTHKCLGGTELKDSRVFITLCDLIIPVIARIEAATGLKTIEPLPPPSVQTIEEVYPQEEVAEADKKKKKIGWRVHFSHIFSRDG